MAAGAAARGAARVGDAISFRNYPFESRETENEVWALEKRRIKKLLTTSLAYNMRKSSNVEGAPMPQKSDIPKGKKTIRLVPQPGGPQRLYSNFVLAQSNENETQLTFCDVEPLLDERAKQVAEQQQGIHPVPVVAKMVLSNTVAKSLAEVLTKQAKGRESGSSKHTPNS